MRDLLAADVQDTYKGAVHFLMGVLAGAMGLYAVGQWLEDRDRAHAVNAALYLSLVPIEAIQARRHWS